MQQYLLRLDDASEYMDIKRWESMEKLLNQYHILPLFGIIPNNKDDNLTNRYSLDPAFWDKMQRWVKNGWIPALHGYDHKYLTQSGGINPVNLRSEFAGLSFEQQCEKIEKGYEILQQHNISPKIFFAPSHTFDENTLCAIKQKTPIRIISDTVANDIYYKKDFFYIPQQTGKVRNLPFKFVTFCYHPNEMTEKDFEELEEFLKMNQQKFVDLNLLQMKKRKVNLFDYFLKKLYFAKKHLQNK